MTWSVAVYKGRVLVRELEIPARGATIGRAPENDIVLEDPTKGVSRFHAEVRAESDGFVLVDLDSQNGVLVDGRKAGRETIRTGLTALIGQYRLVFETVPVQLPVDTGATVASARAVAPPEIVPLPPAAPVPPSSGHPATPRGTQRGPGVTRIVAAIGSVAILAVVTTVAFRMSKASPPPSPPPAVTTATSSVPVAPPPPPPAVDQVLADGVKAVEDLVAAEKFKDADEAVTHLEEVYPAEPRIVGLREEVRLGLERLPKPIVPAAGVRCAGPLLVGRKEKESEESRCKRSLQAEAQLKAAQEALARGEFATAERDAIAIIQQFGDVIGANEVARSARDQGRKKTRADSDALFTAGNQLENADRLRDALNKYDEALQVDPSNTDASARRDGLRTRIEHLVTEASTDAAFKMKVNARADVIKRLNEIVGLLPPSDPRAVEAIAQLKGLTGK